VTYGFFIQQLLFARVGSEVPHDSAELLRINVTTPVQVEHVEGFAELFNLVRAQRSDEFIGHGPAEPG
jgi:hypothetical protein